MNETVKTYERHIKGESMRKIARELNVAPSTVSRRVVRVENAREDPLIDHYIDWRRDSGSEVSDESAEEAMRLAAAPGHVMVVSKDRTVAGIYDLRKDKVIQSVPVETMGFLMVHKKITLDHISPTFMYYVLAKRPKSIGIDANEKACTYTTAYPENVKMIKRMKDRKILNAEQARIAIDILMEWEKFSEKNTGDVAKFCADTNHIGSSVGKLQPGLKDAVIAILLEGNGKLVDCEKELGWPSRSGKLMLVFALDALIQIQN